MKIIVSGSQDYKDIMVWCTECGKEGDAWKPIFGWELPLDFEEITKLVGNHKAQHEIAVIARGFLEML